MAVNPTRVALCSAAKLGELTLTSDATVIRAVRKLGYDDLYELRQSILQTTARWHNPSRVLEDQIAKISDVQRSYQPVIDDTIALLHALRDTLDAEAWDRAVELLASSATVHTYGIGPSRVLGDYLAQFLRRHGIRTHAFSNTGITLADELLSIDEHDTLVLFPTLRHFREIDVAITHAERRSARVIVVTETLGASLRDRVDVVLTTPQSTTTATDGVTIGMALVRALELAIASRNEQRALASFETMNELRTAIVGGDIDL